MLSRLPLTLLLLGAAFALSAGAQQTYPTKPIRVISPWAPGGPAEGLARVVTAKMAEGLGQPIVIESKPGANGTIGTAFVAKSAPDGYTILLSHLGPTAISPASSPTCRWRGCRRAWSAGCGVRCGGWPSCGPITTP